MKTKILLSIFAGLLSFQLIAYQTKDPMLPSCGLGMDKDHPCHCLQHTNEVQNEYMEVCLRDQFEKDPGQRRNVALLACAREMPEHCTIIERYGNWHKNEKGEHDMVMPNQCTKACLMSHCKCQDGEVCHIAHYDDGKEKDIK